MNERVLDLIEFKDFMSVNNVSMLILTRQVGVKKVMFIKEMLSF